MWIQDSIGVASATAAAGVLIGVLAFLTARYGPAGSNWSFRGNGALAVYAAIPAVLAAGWTAVTLRYRLQPLWVVLSLGTGLVGLVLATFDALLLPVFGTQADQRIGPVLLLALGVWTVLAPVLALMLPIRSAARGRTSIGVVFAEAAAVVIGLAGGLAATTVALPAGS